MEIPAEKGLSDIKRFEITVFSFTLWGNTVRAKQHPVAPFSAEGSGNHTL